MRKNGQNTTTWGQLKQESFPVIGFTFLAAVVGGLFGCIAGAVIGGLTAGPPGVVLGAIVGGGAGGAVSASFMLRFLVKIARQGAENAKREMLAEDAISKKSVKKEKTPSP